MKKVLSINDKQENDITVKAIVEDQLLNCYLLTAFSGEEGIKIAQEEQPDAILLDIVMPGIDGYETCRRLKEDELTRHIPVLMLTAINTGPASGIKGLNIGADAFLSKPINRVELAAQIKVMLRIKETEDKLREDKNTLKRYVLSTTKELKKSERKYRLLFEKMLNGFAYHKIVTDKKGKPIDYIFLEINDGFERLTGLKRDEIIGKKVTEVIPGIETDPTDWIGRYGIVATCNKETHFESFAAPLNRWFSVYAFCPQKGYFAVIFSDITDQKESHKEITKLSSVVEQSPSVIVITNLIGQMEYVNPKFTRLTGYSSNEVIGKNVGILNSGNKSVVDYKELWKTISSGNEWHGEFYNKKKNGRFFWEAASISPIFDKQDKITSYIKVAEDITKRKKAEEALIESEEKFRSTFENSSIAMTISDRNGMYTKVNRAALKIFGYTEKEFMTMKLSDLAYPGEATQKSDMVHKLWAGEIEGISIEKRYIHKDGHVIWGNTTVAPLLDFKGKVKFLLDQMQDITERKKADLALKRSEEQIRAYTLYFDTKVEEEKKRLAREIHDGLGQLLTGLKMELLWIKKKIPDDNDQINKKFEEMTKLIDSGVYIIHDLSMQLRPNMLDDLGLIETIKWKLDEFQIHTNIKYKVVFEPDEFTVELDRSTSLFRILLEVLNNIFRHSGASKVDVSLINKPNEIILKVKDDGKGITDEEINSSFSFGIIGIKERVNIWKGNAQFEGVQGKGTTVTINIPI